MAVQPVLMLGNEKLRCQSEKVQLGRDDLSSLIQDLSDTLHHVQAVKKIGRAIAAIQIGVPRQLIYMQSKARKIIMINPEIIKKSKQKIVVWDSCFSADLAFFSKTLRHKEIVVQYFDEHQNKITEQFKDDLSELFQHEIDHLHGILFTDHMIDHQIIMRSEWEKIVSS